MLILSRREAECICLGDDIVLTIVAVGNDKVRIGVKAPPGIRILRNELEVQRPSVPFPSLNVASSNATLESQDMNSDDLDSNVLENDEQEIHCLPIGSSPSSSKTVPAGSPLGEFIRRAA